MNSTIKNGSILDVEANGIGCREATDDLFRCIQLPSIAKRLHVLGSKSPLQLFLRVPWSERRSFDPFIGG